MSKPKPVLWTMSILIDPPDEEYLPYLDEQLIERVKTALVDATKDLPNVEVLYGGEFVDLDPEFVNCFMCEHCGRWSTDVERPEPITGLLSGRLFEGMLLCDECECWKHDPEYGWADEQR